MQRFARVGRIHLITAAIAELRSGLGSLTKRPVEHRGEFCRVRPDGRIFESFRIQMMADGRHASVHHVGRRHNVRTGTGVRQRRLGQPLERDVVVHIVADHLAAMAMAGVFAVTNVRRDDDLLALRFDCPHRALHNPIGSIGTGCHFVLLFRDSKEDHRAHAERLRFLAFLDGHIDGNLGVARHGADFLAHAFAFDDEERQHELRRFQVGFAHERT